MKDYDEWVQDDEDLTIFAILVFLIQRFGYEHIISRGIFTARWEDNSPTLRYIARMTQLFTEGKARNELKTISETHEKRIGEKIAHFGKWIQQSPTDWLLEAEKDQRGIKRFQKIKENGIAKYLEASFEAPKRRYKPEFDEAEDDDEDLDLDDDNDDDDEVWLESLAEDDDDDRDNDSDDDPTGGTADRKEIHANLIKSESIITGIQFFDERIRLDAAAPPTVLVEQTFNIAIAVRNPNSPKLQEAGLDNVTSVEGTIERKDPDKAIKFRVWVVQSPAFQITPDHYIFLLYPNTDTEAFFFSAIAKLEGQQSIIINASQIEEDVTVASTRLVLTVNIDIERLKSIVRPSAIQLMSIASLSPSTFLQNSMKGEAIMKVNLLEQLDKGLNGEELKELLFGFDLDIENIRGETKRDKMMEVIKLFARNNDLASLVKAVNQLRPNTPAR